MIKYFFKVFWGSRNIFLLKYHDEQLKSKRLCLIKLFSQFPTYIKFQKANIEKPQQKEKILCSIGVEGETRRQRNTSVQWRVEMLNKQAVLDKIEIPSCLELLNQCWLLFYYWRRIQEMCKSNKTTWSSCVWYLNENLIISISSCFHNVFVINLLLLLLLLQSLDYNE